MIIVPCVQGTPEWIAARCGLPTASQFHRIITPKTMKPSASADGYIRELIAERLLGAALDSFTSEWMERGQQLEPDAVAYYELQRDQETQQVGFITTDDGRVGCSPDRLVGDDGGLEIKCPSPTVHVENLMGMGDKHRTQVQGALWVTGRKWWDLLSFHPDMPPALVRVERDEKFIGVLESALEHFLVKLDAAWQTVEAMQ